MLLGSGHYSRVIHNMISAFRRGIYSKHHIMYVMYNCRRKPGHAGFGPSVLATADSALRAPSSSRDCFRNKRHWRLRLAAFFRKFRSRITSARCRSISSKRKKSDSAPCYSRMVPRYAGRTRSILLPRECSSRCGSRWFRHPFSANDSELSKRGFSQYEGLEAGFPRGPQPASFGRFWRS